MLRAGCELLKIDREWSIVKSHASLHLTGRSTEEVFPSLFRSHANQCYNFLLLVEIVLVWPLSTVVVERGFSINDEQSEVKNEFRGLEWCPQDSNTVLPNPKSQKITGICQLWRPLKGCYHVLHRQYST